MLQHILNEKIIEAVKQALPEGENIAQQLMSLLLIGKESVYRRLRGEVLFTFEEVIKISKAFNISIDNITEIQNNKKAIFDLSLLEYQKDMSNYAAKLRGHISIFKEMQKAKDNKARYVINNLPYNLYLSFDNLSKFKYFKWLYQVNSPNKTLLYKDVKFPDEIITLQKTFIVESKRISHSLFILDRNIFLEIIHDIEYFFKLNLITIEDLKLLQSELLDILSCIETCAIEGVNKQGSRISIYLSNIDLEATYCHFEYDKQQKSTFTLYGMDGISSQLSSVCQKQKEWIISLKRFSTLITQSGELQRADYFNKQRELINNIC